MDDTNPTKEDTEYVDAIQADIHWLGFDWGDRFFYGCDYFEKDYEFAVELIKKGLAYVCDLTPEQAKEYRGDIGTPAKSPVPRPQRRGKPRPVRAHEKRRIPRGQPCTLRAKIDLASGNFNMRDPVIYRIRYMHHHRQGDKWCIYPMYDFAHPIQDALEGITHSLCSLEFEAHRPLYDWVVNNVSVPCQAAPDRVCPPRHRPYGHEQAQAAQARRGALRLRLGRSPHADALRPAPPRLSRRPPSATSASASAWRRRPTPSSTHFWSTACART